MVIHLTDKETFLPFERIKRNQCFVCGNKLEVDSGWLSATTWHKTSYFKMREIIEIMKLENSSQRLYICNHCNINGYEYFNTKVKQLYSQITLGVE